MKVSDWAILSSIWFATGPQADHEHTFIVHMTLGLIFGGIGLIDRLFGEDDQA